MKISLQSPYGKSLKKHTNIRYRLHAYQKKTKSVKPLMIDLTTVIPLIINQMKCKIKIKWNYSRILHVRKTLCMDILYSNTIGEELLQHRREPRTNQESWDNIVMWITAAECNINFIDRQ